jgi:predicted transcriptional regulator of viral defense system
MNEPSGFGSTPPNQNPTVRVSAVAERQWGVISWRQLRSVGLSKATISNRIARGHLHRVHPGVYAVGHRRLSTEGQLSAALLYAGPGAALSHVTAVWWWGLVDHEPIRTEVSAPGYTRSVSAVLVHHPGRVNWTQHRGLPTTTIAQTLLDFAAKARPDGLRHALAEADYRRLLDRAAVNAILARGHPGSAALRRGLRDYFPELARARRELERRFLMLCRSGRIPLPEVNVKVCGLKVDMLWRRQRLIVELDGGDAHGTPAQIGRDHRRDLRLRTAGYLVLRYIWEQIADQREHVIAEVQAELLARS